MGYERHRIITYTLLDEPGTSLLAAGWTRCGETDGGEWTRVAYQAWRLLTGRLESEAVAA